MISDILNTLYEAGCREVVITELAKKQYGLGGIDKERFNICIMNDARSVSFCALGKNRQTLRPVSMIADECELSHMHTGITEAFYQNAGVIIVSIGSNKIDFYSSYKVIANVIEIQDIHRYINTNSMKTPLIICVPKNASADKKIDKNIDIVTDICSHICISEAVVHTDTEPNEKKKGIQYIVRKEQYGVVSRFFGYAAISLSKNYLITDAEKVMRDINAFMMRLIPDNAVIVVVGKIEELSDGGWFRSKGLEYHKCLNKASLYEALSNCDAKAGIIIYNEQEG